MYECFYCIKKAKRMANGHQTKKKFAKQIVLLVPYLSAHPRNLFISISLILPGLENSAD
jgi:hypothetical protein